MRNNKMKGFTLVELLVVIAILAILATVSVVGYTSYIEGAYVSNDTAVVAQLNSFAGILKADMDSELFGKEITEDNVWEATQIILEEMAMEDLKPHALDYGYSYYYNLSTKQFELIKAKDVMPYGLKVILDVFADGEGLKPGFFDYDGALVFLVDTTGTPLANAVRGFYTFDHIEDTDKFGAFQTIVSGLDAAHNNIKNAAQNSVFVTAEGTFYTGTSATGYVFHTEDGINMYESIPVTLTSPVVVPSNVDYIGINAFDVTYNGTGAAVKFEKSAEELYQYLSEGFAKEGVTFHIDGQEWKVAIGVSVAHEGKVVITPTAAPGSVEYPIGGSNPMADFDIFVAATDKSYTSEKENTDGTNVLNVPTIVWHTGSVKLGLYEKDIVAVDTTKPVSSKRVTWALTDADGNETTYSGVALSGDTLTLSRVDGMYPTHTVIYVTATATSGDAHKTFAINLSRGANAAITVDDKATTATNDNNTISVLWGEDASEADGYKNSYTIGATLTGWDANKKDGFTYDSDIVLVENSDLLSTDGSVISTTTTILNENTTSTTISFEVIVGGYYKETVTITLNDARLLFTKAHSNLKYIATEGVVKASDFFKQVDEDATYSNVMIHAYLKPTGNQSMSDLETGTLPTPTGVEGDTSHQMDGVWANINSGAFNTAEFDLDLLTNVTTEKTIVFVVTVDGIRASENYEVTVVPGNNVRVDEDLSRTDNNVVLSDFDLDGAADVNDDGMIKVAAGKTFYGNGFTITVTDGILQYNETQGTNGVVALHGTMRDTKVIGEVFTKWMATVGAKYGSATVTSVNDNAKLINCYIANSRSALRVEKDTLVEDCVFFGGRHANIDVISDGTVLTMRGTCITVNQSYTYKVNNKDVAQAGTGIAIWWSAGIKPEVKVEDYTKADGSVVDGNLVQYNFLSTNDNMPTITTDSLGVDLGSVELIEVDLGIVFDSLINDTKYQNEGFVFTDTTTGTKYVNAGIVYMNKAENEVVTPTGLSGYGMTSYLFNAGKAFPCSGGKYHVSVLCGDCWNQGLFKTAMKAAIEREDMNVVCYSMKSTSDNGKATFANYSTATATYNPNAWDFDANGKIIHNN